MLRKSFSFVVVGTMLFLLAVFIAAGASPAQAQSAGQLQYWVTMEKDLASVRAQQGDFEQGPAALFERPAATGRWQRLEQADRKGSAAPAPRTFGYAVAIDGDYAVVGAQWHDGFKGAAYIFKRKGDGWIQVQKLSPPDLGRFDHFGSAVSISGDYAVVAATWHDLLRGAAYVFKREGKEWVQQDKLTATDAKTDDRFGRTVRIDGSEITITSASAGLQDAATSLAYRFRRSGDAWVEGQKVALPAMEKSGAYTGELLIESQTGSDLLALAEIIGRDTEMPPLLAPSSTEPHFIRGDINGDGLLDWTDWNLCQNGPPFPCDDAADVNDDGVVDMDDCDYLGTYLDNGEPPPPQPFPGCGPDPTADELDCAQYTGPCITVTATDDAFEDRVEIVWTSFGLDAIVYRIERDGALISLASSEDSLYADKTGEPAVPYNYCVKVVDMDGGQLDSDCDDGSRIIFPPDHVQASDGDFDRFVRVTWDDMSSVEKGYMIKRSKLSEPQSIDTFYTSPNAVAYDDTSAEPETTYYYEVKAFDADTNYSTAAGDEGTRGSILPPLEVSASDGEYVDTVKITWIDQAENEAGYNIYRNDSLIASTDSNVQSYDDTTADYGEYYTYCVTTRDKDSGESIRVCDQGGIGILPTPAWVKASDSTYDDCIEITWDDPSDLEDGFWILRDGEKLDSTQANATFYKDYTAVPDSTYEYCVYAFTKEGGSSGEVCDSGYRAIVLPPFDVQASDGTREDRVDLIWKSTSTTAVLFKIFRDQTFIKSVGQGTRSYSDYGGTAGQDYEYKIVAVTLHDDQEFVSDTVSDTGRRELKPPTPVTASDEEYEDKIVISWVDNSWLENGYRVSREAQWGTFLRGDINGDWVVDSGDLLMCQEGPPFSCEDAADVNDDGVLDDRDCDYLDAYLQGLGPEPPIPFPDTGRDPTPDLLFNEFCFEASVVDYVWTLGPNRTSLTDYTAVSGVTYRYTVEAYDTVGAVDEVPQGFSAPATDVGWRALLPPTNVRASDGKFEKRVEITWEDNSQAEDGYHIYRGSEHIGSTADNFTSYVDATPAPGATFEYSVAAFDAYGESERASDEGSTVILAPGSFNASDVYENRVVLTWVDLSEVEEGYEITRRSDGAVETFSVGANVTSYTDNTALQKMTYRYCIRAVSNGQSSAEVCDYGQLIEPAGPTTGMELDLRLVASDSAEGDWFGYSVAIDGDVAIVGAPYDDNEYGWDAGAAYIFTRQSDGTWTQTDKLTADSSVDCDEFGKSVAIDGDVAIVGAPGWHTHCEEPRPGFPKGAAFIFTRGPGSTWNQTRIDPLYFYREPGVWEHIYFPGRFGSSVAISGDVAIVGAPETYFYDLSTETYIYDCGLACTIKRGAGGAWPERALNFIISSDWAGDDHFGHSVAIDSSLAIVGAYGKLDNSGSAYIFESSDGGAWYVEKKKLRASDGQEYDCFGMSVGISAGTAIVGAIYADAPEQNRGAAYVFTRASGGGWQQTQKLVASDGGRWDQFGSPVAISGDKAIVGAPQKQAWTGSAYIFSRTPHSGWVEELKLRPSALGLYGTAYGWSVGMMGETVIVGAPREYDGQGAAYVLDMLVPPAAVAASDGTLTSRVRIQWEDRSSIEDGFEVYRDGEIIATLPADVETYDDLEAQPGRTYEYGVQAFTLAGSYSVATCDFGWRPPNGNITGRVTTSSGAGVEGISVGLDPQPIRSLLLDGNGGHVRIPDPEGTFADLSLSSFTIEAWIKYSGSGGSGTGHGGILAKADPELYTWPGEFPFGLQNMRDWGEPGRLRFSMHDSVAFFFVSTDRTNLNDDTWHHVACVRVHTLAQDSLRIYVDSTLEGEATYTGVGRTDNTHDVTLGVGFEPDYWFGGQIDEVRIWKVARTEQEIQATMRQQLKGDEEGLVGYWPLDEDGTGVITDLTQGVHYGTLQDGAYWTDNAAPMDVSATTDMEGNYALANVRYGQETTFQVTPFGEQRQFQPAFRFITLSTESPVENQVDFVETTSFGVCGVVRYEDTDCFVQNVEIHVDGQCRAVTDKNGKFSVGVSKGIHWFKPLLAGHTFDCDSIPLNIEGDTPGVDFVDQTLRTVSGVVSGGCDKPIGLVTITFRSENSCMDISITRNTMDPESTTYEIQLPPQSYFVTGSVDLSSIPEGLSKSDVVKFFDNLGDRMIDLTQADTTLDFIYRAPLQVTIEGFDSYRECPEKLTFLDRDLPGNLPIIPQGEVVPLTIKVNEYYGPGALCALDSATVIIYDEIFDQEGTPVELVLKDGKADYKTFASTPSLIVGRVDSQGNDRSFQKAIRARVVVEGRTPVTATEWVLVTGHVAREGADFVTATSNPFPLYVLRDPPGDQSYAYLEEGYQSRTTINYGKMITGGALGLKLEVKTGVDEKFFIGLGAGTIFDVNAQTFFETKLMAGTMVNTEWGTEVTLTTKEKFSTSPDELFVGGGGDVFVGAGLNFIFAEVGVVDVDLEECEVIRSTSVAFQPNSIATTFSYTQEYIQDVLIPQLQSTVDYYEGLAQPDSAGMFRSMRDNWVTMLAINDSLKQDATLKKNRSFSAGADFEFSFDSDTTVSYTQDVNLTLDLEGTLSGIQAKFKGFGFLLSFPFTAHHEQVLAHTDTSGTSSHALGYVLSDNDIGDHFTVDIKEDGRYPSPVFDVLAGVSSCPHEPWPDPKDGKARMWSRDAPKLLLGGDPVLDNVPPDEAAAFTLNLCNESQTEETREYVLREITTSNPGGAIIKANGNPIGNGLSYFISGDPLNNSNEVTLSVERGPTKYKYPNLALMLYPPCDDNISSTVTFGVNFKSPCSDITLLEPKPGWTYNIEYEQAANGEIDLLLCDFELAVSETDSIEEVGAEYRLLGTGREGPSKWVTIGTVQADDYEKIDTLTMETTITWDVQSNLGLEDGVYELRAFTKCKEGRGYSNTVVGTIDRNAPQVFGTPQPADGELSLGEDISITFNEPIDCKSIDDGDVSLKYLDEPDAGETILTDSVCNGSTIIIKPKVGLASLEGRLLEASVGGICDLVGNTMEDDTTWTFTVRQSAFTWSHRSIIRDVSLGAPGSITAELVNGGDSIVNYDITTKPSWITEVSPQTGSLEAGGTQSVSFAIQEDLPGGSYDSLVVAVSDRGGNAELEIHLTVSCHAPVWSFDPGAYQYTMTIVAEVYDAGYNNRFTDPNDRVAAFVGNQLRGVANINPVKNLALLTVYSNRASGETVRFEVWDSSECKLYKYTEERYAFESDAIHGSPDSPDTLTALEGLPTSVQEIALSQGWNWFSTYVHAEDMSPNGVLSNLTPAPGDMIKSKTDSATFDFQAGWSGTLSWLDSVFCYMIKLSEPGTILLEGQIVDSATTAIPLDTGWNWISYLLQGRKPIADALANLDTALLKSGDVIKSQTAFAQWVTTGTAQWFGTLGFMEPGMGYKLYRQKTTTGEFYYHAGGSPAPPWAGTNEEQEQSAQIAEAEPGWSVDQNAYQYNMTVVAALDIEGDQSRSDKDLIAAFVDGECRGMAQPMYLAAMDRYVAFLMIYSNSVSGETVEFQAFVPGVRAVYNVAEAITYQADGSVGSIGKPLILSTEGIAYEVTDNIPTRYSLSQNYPNPFNPMTTIEYGLPEQAQATIEVFNVLGQRVRTLVSAIQPAGRQKVVWDGKDDQGRDVGSGIYFYRLQAGAFSESKKMVILK